MSKDKTRRNAPCPCGSGKKHKNCCGSGTIAPARSSKYVNAAHEWVDKNILKGRPPVLYGYLILVDHAIPAEEIWNQLQFWSKQYLGYAGNRAQKSHEAIDAEIELQLEADKRVGYRPPFCHKGCANCCYQPVACTDEEAKLIRSHCADNNITIDYERLERQLHHMEFDVDNNFLGCATWDDQPEEDRRCVFLNEGEGTCAIWRVRPLVCRTHLAEKTNEYCRSKNGVPDPRATGIHHPSSSYIMSSVFALHQDSIGKMMNRLLLDQESVLVASDS